jgi:3-phosphoshikimate 1-carboxyvinyltransferase
MAKFFFKGSIPASKSIFNRALVVQSYFPVLDLEGSSTCDDVVHMQEGLEEIRDRSRIDCGEGGTTFRFMALRAGRHKGTHVLEGTPRLMARPQKEIVSILAQLGVSAQVKKNEMYITSDGWKRPRKPVQVDCSDSSQYASSLLLNSWLLDFDLEFELTGEKVSESYFALTLKMMKEFGMRVKEDGRHYTIPSEQRISKLKFFVEPDLSSAFTIAAAGALCGEVQIENFPKQSDQPDFIFLEIFKKMKIDFQQGSSDLQVMQSSLRSIEWDLSQSPDLFPVLAVLCSQAAGTSRLYGAPHLAHKESNRIQKVAELLEKMNISFEALEDGMIIHGNPAMSHQQKFSFDPDKDHRMVMAASLFNLLGNQIEILEPQVINKSFPEFWEITGLQP